MQGKIESLPNRLHNSNKKWYIYTICFIWLRSYFSTVWRRLGIAEADVATLIVLIVLLILSRKVWKGRILMSDVMLYTIIVCCYFFSVLVYPSTSDLIFDNAIAVIFCTFPFIFVGVIFQTVNYEKWIIYCSRLVIILNFIFVFTRISSSSEVDAESMHRAYALLPSVLFMLWQFIRSKDYTDLAFLILGVLLLLSMGSRGPIVCLIFFAACYLLFFKKYNHPWITKSLIFGVSSLLVIGTQYFAGFMLVLFSKSNVSTRIFDNILNDTFINYEDSNGRNTIQSILLHKLNQDTGDIGFGLFSDRVTIGGILREEWYAHNFFVELWFSFGYYIGTFVILMILTLFAYYFFSTSNREKKIFALLLFSLSVVKLLFSGSFIVDQSLFFLIGYCIYGIRESKYKKYRFGNNVDK